jgi:hypothetical protein
MCRLRDRDAARPPELRPLVEEHAGLIENLNAVVVAIGDEEPAARIHSKGVRHVELAGAGSALAERLDEPPVLRPLADAVDRPADDVPFRRRRYRRSRR